jgi:hypothetical protein
VERRQVLTIVRAASALLVVVAIVAQAMVLAANDAFRPTQFFAFFTIQSNLIGVAAFALLVMGRDRPRSHGLESLRGAATVYLMVTFFVVIFLLEGVDVSLKLEWVDITVHKVFPIIVLLDWIVDPPTVRLTIRDVLTWLVYPIAWAILTLVRGALDGWYPYPFLDPANGGYGAVALAVVAITIGFIVISLVVRAFGDLRRASLSEAQPAG